ncbi:KUP/HAK/KT family potassium transporter, partial [Mycobacterium sp.]|uniref:KUP/HAK/KT family potassium transporter n=1 Tax=Mycobacterium sp. TaxID=1785 RepID=UPI003C77A9A2
MASLGSIRYAATRPYRIQSLDDKVRLLNEDLTVHTTSEPVLPLRTVGAAEAVRLAVVVGALGVVFGDIGTSPIYTLATVFNPSDPHPVPLNTDNIYGV